MPLYTKPLPKTLSFLEEVVAIYKHKLDSLVYPNMTGPSDIYNDKYICENIINNINKIKFGVKDNSGISWYMPSKETKEGYCLCHSKEGFLYCYRQLNKPIYTYHGLLPDIRKITIAPNIEHEDWRIDSWSCYILDEEITESIKNILNPNFHLVSR